MNVEADNLISTLITLQRRHELWVPVQVGVTVLDSHSSGGNCVGRLLVNLPEDVSVERLIPHQADEVLVEVEAVSFLARDLVLGG